MAISVALCVCLGCGAFLLMLIYRLKDWSVCTQYPLLAWIVLIICGILIIKFIIETGLTKHCALRHNKPRTRRLYTTIYAFLTPLPLILALFFGWRLMEACKGENVRSPDMSWLKRCHREHPGYRRIERFREAAQWPGHDNWDRKSSLW